jgi:hypothetical protein
MKFSIALLFAGVIALLLVGGVSSTEVDFDDSSSTSADDVGAAPFDLMDDEEDSEDGPLSDADAVGEDDDEDGEDELVEAPGVTGVEVSAPPTAPCDCSCHVADAAAAEPYACSCKCPIVRGYPGPAGPQGPQGRRGPTGHQGVQGARGARGPTGALAAGVHMATTIDCYHQSWAVSFAKKGWSTCEKPGYFITGLWRNTCSKLSCIEWARCCKLGIVI